MSRNGKLIRTRSLFFLIATVTLLSVPQAQAQDDTTWTWRYGNDPDTVERSRGELDSLLSLHRLWLSGDTLVGRRLQLIYAHLKGADLGKAHLEGAWLWNAHLDSADMQFVHLDSASLQEAYLVGAFLGSAQLEGANLRKAHFEGANLLFAHLESADLQKTYLDSAIMYFAYLEGAIFEPATLPLIPLIAQAYGLKQLRYDTDPSALTQLREAFSKAGFKQQERDIICALSRHDASWLSYIFFDLTSEYGSNLIKPWKIFLSIWVICALFYRVGIQKKRKSCLQLILKIREEKKPVFFTEFGELVMWEDEKIAKTPIWQGNPYLRDEYNQTFCKIPMWIRLWWWALFFSMTAAFNIGFRDVNFGRWLRLLTRKEFDLKPTGWLRVVSGVQALSSVYLVGLWILSFSGTPFK